MNKERKQRLSDVTSMIDDTIGEVEDISADESDAFDNSPEGLQESRADKYYYVIDKLDEISSDLQKVTDKILKTLTKL